MSEYPRRAADAAGTSPPLSLRQACAKAGLDRDGERCPDCPVRALCQSELRWLVTIEGTMAPTDRLH